MVASTLLLGTGVGSAQAADLTDSRSQSDSGAAQGESRGAAALQRDIAFSDPALLKAAGMSPNVAKRPAGWREKLFVFALRHGGSLLEAFLKRLSPRAARWVGGNLNKLANFLDSLENAAEYPIIIFLTHAGLPIDVATELARVILFFIA